MAKKTPTPYQFLGSAIRRRRRFLGLSQSQLGEFAGCGLTFVNQLESGKETVRLNKLIEVLRVLGLALSLELGKDVIRISDKI